MRFSEVFSIPKSPTNDDWFDNLTETDTPLFVDPFLVWSDSDPFWQDAHSHLLDFFEMVFALIAEAGGNTKHFAWKQAANLLLFPEPAEFRLGVADGSPLGAGSGRGLQGEMLAGIQAASNVGMSRIAHIETIALFQGGMGVDRISDAVCNILKSHFIRYTEAIVKRHNIPSVPTSIVNASWSPEYKRWASGVHSLPRTEIEVERRGKVRQVNLPVLLTPHRFLRDIPIADSNQFWEWSWTEMGEQLRGDFNYDVTSNVTRRIKARLARENPEAVALYLRAVEDRPMEPYPINDDPRLLVSWYERGRDLLGTVERRWVDVDESKDAFQEFTMAVVEEFKGGVENDAWRLLWYGNRGAGERNAQVLFRSIVRHYCKANDVDLSGESDAGRGPVDFKFSRGWKSRALIEIKLVRHKAFWDGILAQTPTYQIAEGVRDAIFVAIAYSEEEMSLEFQGKLRRAAEIVSDQKGIKVRAVLVDATQKVSGSKVRDPKLKGMLNEVGEPVDLESDEGSPGDPIS